MRPTRRRVFRKDGNAKPIIRAWRDVGALVFEIERPFDVLVAFRGALYLADIKNPETGHGWTDDQLDALEECTRQRVTVWRIETIDDAMVMLGIKRKAAA